MHHLLHAVVDAVQLAGSRSTMSGIGSGSTGGWPSMVLARCGRIQWPLLASSAVICANWIGVACM
ncbi:hypothetical protein BH77_21265 [Pseudomonas aeruginosa C2773C]|nr:hypothetical protein BH77_21265 [Pseudomonas aeruginosa C2773C]